MPPNQEHTPDPLHSPSEPVTTPQPTGQVVSPNGGMRTIQPMANGPSPTPTPVGQTQPPIQPMPIAGSGGNAQSMHVDGQPVAYQNYNQLEAEKPKRHWLRTASLAILAIVIIGAGAVLATNQNIRATVLRQKFVTYNYHNKAGIGFTLKFYKGSSIQQDTIGGVTENYLISPIQKKGTLPVEISVTKVSLANASQFGSLTGQTNNVNSQLSNIRATESCQGLGTISAVSITALNTNAQLCYTGPITTGSQHANWAELSNFESSGTLYSVYISQHFDRSLSSTSAEAQQIKAERNLNPFNTDLETIVSSIKPL